MPVPSINDIVHSDLFTSESELRDKFPQTSAERLLLIRAMYNWLISNQETKDKEFVDETVCRYGVCKVFAYDDFNRFFRSLTSISFPNKKRLPIGKPFHFFPLFLQERKKSHNRHNISTFFCKFARIMCVKEILQIIVRYFLDSIRVRDVLFCRIILRLDVLLKR